MERVRTIQHSGLYYRNTFIVWVTTILVFWLALNVHRHWLSMLVFILALYFCFFLWAIYKSVHPGRSIFRRRIPSFEVDLECEKVEYLSRDGVELCGWFIKGRKRQVIILLHGLGGSGLAMSPQARMLWRACVRLGCFLRKEFHRARCTLGWHELDETCGHYSYWTEDTVSGLTTRTTEGYCRHCGVWFKWNVVGPT